MHSSLPKVLHPLAGDDSSPTSSTPHALAPRGDHDRHRSGQRRCCGAALAAPDLAFVVQDPPRGTGDATRIALSAMPGDGVTLVGLADVPLALRPT